MLLVFVEEYLEGRVLRFLVNRNSSLFIIEHNYPPKANAGSDVIIQLPNNSVVLHGGKSSDDKVECNIFSLFFHAIFLIRLYNLLQFYYSFCV